MTDRKRRTVWLRPLIILGTAVLAWAALLIGQQFTTVTVMEGQPSPETFLAETLIEILNQEATDAATAVATAAVPDEFERDAEVDVVVLEQIQALFEAVRSGTVVVDAEPLPAVTTTTIPSETTTIPDETTTTTQATDGGEDGGETTSTTEAPTTTTTMPEVPRTSGVSGTFFIDVDGDSLLTDDVDHPLPDVRVVAYDSLGDGFEAITVSDGTYSITRMAAGEAMVLVDVESLSDRLTTDLGMLLRTVELTEDTVTEFLPQPVTVVLVSSEIQEVNLENRFFLSAETVDVLVELATEDVTREILGRDSWLLAVQTGASQIATDRLSLNGGILSEELQDVRNDVQQGLSVVALPGNDDRGLTLRTGGVITEIAAVFLQANKSVDEELTQTNRDAAAAAVVPVNTVYEVNDEIVSRGTVVTPEILLALEKSGVLTEAAPRYAALGVVVSLVVLMLSLYLGRFRPGVWGSMRRMALFGMLIVLAALSARSIAVFAMDNPAAGYLIPAAAFGLMAAILFDARIAVLMSMAVGSMTAIATLDPGFTLFATLGTLTPVPFVSSISARRELRIAVLYMMVLLGVLAGGVAWFFQDGATARDAVLYGALNGFLSGLIGSALLSFFEIIFDVTTSLRLLDLTDRNHPGLRLLEDKAIGTFNHSLMVGTLADQASRAVDANALLARAAAYYHDLGKTENPQFFIENQFGIQNPHDRMPPEESANVIRQHVIDGRRLAKQFRIPADVADGVVTHHGDGIMHFFYGKAVERYGEERVDIEDYRHVGRKPTSKEMAIVMMADSVEGACRAIFQVQEPSPQRITEVVERIVGEKVADGQLSECSLTLGDLTRAKAAMADALIGYYHQRIPYPNFPTPGALEGGEDESEDDPMILPSDTADRATTD